MAMGRQGMLERSGKVWGAFKAGPGSNPESSTCYPRNACEVQAVHQLRLWGSGPCLCAVSGACVHYGPVIYVVPHAAQGEVDGAHCVLHNHHQAQRFLHTAPFQPPQGGCLLWGWRHSVSYVESERSRENRCQLKFEGGLPCRVLCGEAQG